MPHGFNDQVGMFVSMIESLKIMFWGIGGIQAVLKASCSILPEHTCAIVAYDCGPGIHILSILVRHDCMHQCII